MFKYNQQLYIVHLFCFVFSQVQQMADSYVTDVDKQLATKTKELLGWWQQARRLFSDSNQTSRLRKKNEHLMSDGSTSAESGICVFFSCVNKC